MTAQQQVEIYREKLSKIKGNTPADAGRRSAIEDDIARAQNPIAALLGIAAERGIYAMTDAEGCVMAVIDYMPHRSGSTTCEAAYDAVHRYGIGNPAFGLRAEQTHANKKAAFAARFLLRDNGKNIKHPDRVAAFERIAAVHRFTLYGPGDGAWPFLPPDGLDGNRLLDGSWRVAA